MRLIDAEYLLYGMGIFSERENGAEFMNGVDAVAKMIEKAETVHARHDWTPCAEGMPESDQWCDDGFKKTYRVTVESDAGNLSPILGNPYRYVTTALFELGEWVLDSEDEEFEETDKVIAWMNQPDPYNHDRKED